VKASEEASVGPIERASANAASESTLQYDAADPENRLVTSELERRWNLALQHLHEIEVRIEQHGTAIDQDPTPTMDDFHRLAQQVETIRTDPATSARLKKRIVRALIEEVLVDVDSSQGELLLTLHWKGGVHTELRLPRRRRGQSSTQTSRELIEAITVLARIASDDGLSVILRASEVSPSPCSAMTFASFLGSELLPSRRKGSASRTWLEHCLLTG
jgi:hypothetical protein